MDTFRVSIKGVLQSDGKLLLRKNERQEFELLGGHLEKDDISPEQRLITEFLEESGISVEVGKAREPWLYEIGTRNVLILPFLCRAVKIPEHLFDMDGGTLHWIAPESLGEIRMPQGYKDTIMGATPHTSTSAAPVGSNAGIPAPQGSYFVKVCVKQGLNVLACSPLKARCSPGDIARTMLGKHEKDARLTFQLSVVDQEQRTVTLFWERDACPPKKESRP
ncbi:MAG: hypothetical protein K5841_06995 [Fretibacterium sp.]|nr:hypothetical protein [Fretibacterium sp.]